MFLSELEVKKVRHHIRNMALITTLILLAFSARAKSELVEQFEHPPQPSGPYVWWHWMNGNINQQEAIQDLQWLADTGVAGVQVFEAGLGQPAPEERRLVFGSPEWKSAMQHSAEKAKSLGLSFSITTAPGWSASGGPWVEPADAMKKVVWSKTTVLGGQRVSIQLSKPPSVAGPFQDIPFDAIKHAVQPVQSYYQDIAVFAVPTTTASSQSPTISVSGKPVLGAESLNDGKFWPGIGFATNDNGALNIDLSLDKPITIQGVRLGLPGKRGFGSPHPPVAHWQFSEDGKYFTTLATLNSTDSLVRTHSFKAVTARYFRLRLERSLEPGFLETLHYVKGVNPIPFQLHESQYVVSEISLLQQPVLDAVEEKAGFAAAQDYYALDNHVIEDGIKLDQVIDITEFVSPDGQLEWWVPAGNWQIVRMGYSLTGHENGPAPMKATGLEADKLSAIATQTHMSHYFANYSDKDGTLFPGITGLLSDSIESGPQNWTPSLLNDFKETYAYDPLPWLPALSGEIINNTHQTERFLWDFRQLISHKLTTDHYAILANEAHARGLTYFAEALEDRRPQLGNDLDMRTQADVPMAAYWHHPEYESPKATYLMDVKGAASVASLYGKRIVAAEAMTTFGHPWAVGPKELKPIADRAFVSGVNRLMLHSSVHQAQGLTYSPGMTLMPLLGHYFNRNEPWADMARPWITYLARTQFLLQHGRPVVSFVYFIGEEAPVTGLFAEKLPQDIPTGFDFDFISAAGLDELSAENGQLTSRGGAQYQFIYLGGSSNKMTLTTLKKLQNLAGNGAIIVGQVPNSSPSLADDNKEFQAAIKTFGTTSGVMANLSLSQAISQLSIKPQWQLTDTNGPKALIRELITEDGKLFYLVNSSKEETHATLTLPHKSNFVYRLQALDGSIQALPLADTPDSTQVPVSLGPHEAAFILLSDKSFGLKVSKLPVGQCDKPVQLNNPWTINFDPRFAQIGPQSIDAIKPLNEFTQPEVHFYSGISHYSSTFTLDENCSSPTTLILEQVADVAQVFINGKEAGYLWTPPYKLDISGLLSAGVNTINIHVANLWTNKVIGMANGINADKELKGIYQVEAPLRIAGIKGEVKLE